MKTATNGMGSWKRWKLAKGMRASRTPGKAKGMVPPTLNRSPGTPAGRTVSTGTP